MGCAWSSDVDLVGDGVRIHTIKELAQGGFSQVFLCEDVDSREKYAVKKIQITQPSEEAKVRFEAEQHKMASRTANIVPLLALIEFDCALHLVFPFYSRGTVADMLLKRRKNSEYLPQTQVIKFSLDLCSALSVVHSEKMAHRDLKTANLIIDDTGNALLLDFGSAIKIPLMVEDAKMRQKMVDDCAENCSMPYRAPELFSCDIGTVIDEKADLWSLGCCIYALCYFVSPFDLANERGDSVALASQSPHKIIFPADAPYDDRLKDVIRKILRTVPGERMPLGEIEAAVEKLSTGSLKTAPTT